MEPDGLRAVRRMANERGLGISLHTDEVLFDSQGERVQLWPAPPRFWTASTSSTRDVLHAHCAHFSEAGRNILARRHGAVSYNPASYMYLGSGVPSIPRLLDLGVTAGLGADGRQRINSQDMLEALKVGAFAEGCRPRPAIFTAGDACAWQCPQRGSVGSGRFRDARKLANAPTCSSDPHHAKSIPSTIRSPRWSTERPAQRTHHRRGGKVVPDETADRQAGRGCHSA